ncbi:MAG TPA: glycoside hydrolase family 3 N-terminal domain-containing protein [Ktedonobacterales bacterium]|jgi:beta-N-acetylhexosaminidase|nr:glycoside hydrolase family 3 N-terminal domain-containing protein [Ktedonobacterales bacterium]
MISEFGELSIERQIGQLFMVGFTGTEPTPEIVEMIQRWHIGGVILFSRNCRDARQVSRLTHDLQRIARDAGHPAPLLIATDQENGLVRRLGASMTNFPGAMALGATRDAALTQAVAEATGQELRALGVNMNLAPDADVNSNPANPVIGVRSFGEDPQLVARLVAAAVIGQRAAGVASVLKHFPGHGDTAVDSHLGLPTVPYALKRLERVELAPFRAGVAAGAESVMLAHLRLPELAPDDIAASLSPVIVRLLRDALGFSGVIMTDCLEMDAIAKTVGVERGSEMALRAGVDIVLISHHIEPQRAAIALARAAVASGGLSADAIRGSAARVLDLKTRLGSWDALPTPVASASVSSDAHQRLSAEAYARSTTLVRDDAALLPIGLTSGAQILVIAQPPASVTKAVDTVYDHEDLVAAIRARQPHARDICLSADASAEEVATTVRKAQECELVIVATINAHLDPTQRDLMRRLIATGQPLIGIAVCNPYDLGLFPELRTALATYDYIQPALRAAADALFGAFTPEGRLPVSLPGDLPGSDAAFGPERR